MYSTLPIPGELVLGLSETNEQLALIRGALHSSIPKQIFPPRKRNPTFPDCSKPIQAGISPNLNPKFHPKFSMPGPAQPCRTSPISQTFPEHHLSRVNCGVTNTTHPNKNEIPSPQVLLKTICQFRASVHPLPIIFVLPAVILFPLFPPQTRIFCLLFS